MINRISVIIFRSTKAKLPIERNLLLNPFSTSVKKLSCSDRLGYSLLDHSFLGQLLLEHLLLEHLLLGIC